MNEYINDINNMDDRRPCRIGGLFLVRLSVESLSLALDARALQSLLQYLSVNTIKFPFETGHQAPGINFKTKHFTL